MVDGCRLVDGDSDDSDDDDHGCEGDDDDYDNLNIIKHKWLSL